MVVYSAQKAPRGEIRSVVKCFPFYWPRRIWRVKSQLRKAPAEAFFYHHYSRFTIGHCMHFQCFTEPVSYGIRSFGLDENPCAWEARNQRQCPASDLTERHQSASDMFKQKNFV